MIYGTELKAVQQVELEILAEIIRICTHNEIEYFIIGGTALGAIRHKGFIPWDDDIDIGMTRANYNKFIRIAQTQLENSFFLQTVNTDEKSPFYFSKVRKKETKFIEYYCRNLDINQGIFVDIFPFDNVPDKTYLRKLQLIKTSVLSNLFIAKCVKEVSMETKSIKGLSKKIMRYALHYLLKPVSKKLLYTMLDNEVQKYNKEDTLLRCYINFPFLSIKNDNLYPLRKIQFENLQVYAPKDCHTYLSSHYGDYMKLPPKEKRYGHKPYILEL